MHPQVYLQVHATLVAYSAPARHESDAERTTKKVAGFRFHLGRRGMLSYKAGITRWQKRDRRHRMGGFQDTFQRKEIKYILNAAQYREMLRWLQPIARVDSYGETTIQNIYFDTPDFRLVRSSMEKPLYKEKLRLRTYGIPEVGSTAFIEIKKKYLGVVYKRRIGMPYGEALRVLCHGELEHLPGMARAQRRLEEQAQNDRHAEAQIAEEIAWFCRVHRPLLPAMKIRYDRIAMAGIADPSLRITFDRNLRWSMHLDLRDAAKGEALLQPQQALMEIKIQGAMRPDIAQILSGLGVYPASFSKYGEGFAQYYEDARRSRRTLSWLVERAWQNARDTFGRPACDHDDSGVPGQSGGNLENRWQQTQRTGGLIYA